MKVVLPVITMLWAIMAVSGMAWAEQHDVPAEFALYPVCPIPTAEPAKVILASEAERMFRTRLRKAAKQPANFAGEYVLTTWGCGAGCIDGAIVSLNSGVVTFLPTLIHKSLAGGEALQFRINSRLLILTGSMDEESEHAIYYYEFVGDEFKHLKTIPFKP